MMLYAPPEENASLILDLNRNGIGDRKYGKCKERCPNPIIQMGMFMNGDGISLAFSLFPGNVGARTILHVLLERLQRKIYQHVTFY